jgi:hypothetical protein
LEKLVLYIPASDYGDNRPLKSKSGTIQNRRLVASKWLSASFEKESPQIQHLREAAEGLHLNLIQK